MMDTNSLVSIITPCYNSGQFIDQAIESVLAQTYQNWEMLVVDDCSTDDSVNVILKYMDKDKRIKYFRTDSNSGSPVLPRNIGIQNSQGRYIAFLDSDDIWFSNKLTNQIRFFENENVAIVYSYYEKMKEDGIRNNRIIKSPNSVGYTQLLKGDCIGFLTAIYDTMKVGKHHFQSVGAEDYAYWLSILRSGYIARNTNTVEALYRVRNNSVSTNKMIASRWTWNIYRKYLGMPFIKSSYYYIFYIFNAILKYFR